MKSMTVEKETMDDEESIENYVKNCIKNNLYFDLPLDDDDEVADCLDSKVDLVSGQIQEIL
jgi:hypothetical protein